MKIPPTIRRLYHLRNGRKNKFLCIPSKKESKRKTKTIFLLKARDSPIKNAANEVACPDGNEYPFSERLLA